MFNYWNIAFWEYEFFAPQLLWLLVLSPLVFLGLRYLTNKQQGHFKYTQSEKEQANFGQPNMRLFLLVRDVLLTIIFALLVFTFSKPFHFQIAQESQPDFKDGIDIVLTMDVSMSMLAEDFSPNRLEAAKKVAIEFCENRPSDRIGLVAFAGEAFGACPLTLDRGVLIQQIEDLNGNEIEPGTAIGVGLGTAVTKLRSDSLASKVVILLTDGSNNYGDISPETAAGLAKSKNVRVYTIGVGSNGDAPTPVITPFGVEMQQLPVEIDEVTLSRIASITGGKYYRATDEKSLKKIYEEIDRLEKRKLIEKHYSTPPKSTPWAFINWSIVLVALIAFTQLFYFKVHA
jgi:Ca-activated chloride channel family protein